METPLSTPLLSANQVAAHLSFRPSTIALWARIGKINGTKIGGRWRFTTTEVDDFLGE